MNYRVGYRVRRACICSLLAALPVLGWTSTLSAGGAVSMEPGKISFCASTKTDYKDDSECYFPLAGPPKGKWTTEIPNGTKNIFAVAYFKEPLGSSKLTFDAYRDGKQVRGAVSDGWDASWRRVFINLNVSATNTYVANGVDPGDGLFGEQVRPWKSGHYRVVIRKQVGGSVVQIAQGEFVHK